VFWKRNFQAHTAQPDAIAWISFEELKADLPGCIRRIAAFCNIDASDELIAQVAGVSDFAAMKKQFAEVDAAKVKAGTRVKKNHIREGKVGAWRNQFTPEQEAMLMAHHTKQCKALGLPLDLFQLG